MKIEVTKKHNKNYGKHRTIKVFALFPRFLYYNGKNYFVWLEYFYQDEHYTSGLYGGGDAWYIESNYPILPDVKPTYTC